MGAIENRPMLFISAYGCSRSYIFYICFHEHVEIGEINSISSIT